MKSNKYCQQRCNPELVLWRSWRVLVQYNLNNPCRALWSEFYNCSSLKIYNWFLFKCISCTFFTCLKSSTFIKSVFTICHLFTHRLSYYCTAHTASWASLIRPLYSKALYHNNTLNMNETMVTRRDNWNPNQSCDCDQPKHTGAWADGHVNAVYWIMYLRNTIQQGCLNHQSVGGVRALSLLCMAQSLKIGTKLGF